MIGSLRATTGTSAAREYAGTMAGLWNGLSGTLRALDALAADLHHLEEAADRLRALQYRLHWSSELLAGVDPPEGARSGHAELAEALLDARDATGEIAAALERGDSDAVRDLLFEWRGALFRVRLARLRLGTRPEPASLPDSSPGSGAAGLLALFGAVAFVAGAALLEWPVWAAGIALVTGAVLAHRP